MVEFFWLGAFLQFCVLGKLKSFKGPSWLWVTCMLSKIYASPLGSPNSSDQSAANPKGHKLFGKKLYLIVAAVAIVVIVVGALLIPQGAASIPLSVNFNVGETMVYHTNETISIKAGNTSLPGNEGFSQTPLSFPGQETMQVIGFDGEFYTINNTVTLTEANIPFNFSTIEKMDKTGYSVSFVNIGNTSQEIPNSPVGSQYLAQLLSKPVVKVGDSVTDPYPTLPGNLSSSLQITGDLILTFKGIQDLTVPAGTYKVFRVDLTSNNLSLTINLSFPHENITTSLTMNYQMYIEYNTMRQIESSMQQTAEFQSTQLNYTMSTTNDMTLYQDINP